MKNKNNAKFMQKLNGQPRFSFRKLSIGLCTMALGSVFLMNNTQEVKADTTNDQTATVADPKNTGNTSNVGVNPDGTTNPNHGSLPTSPDVKEPNKKPEELAPITDQVKTDSNYQDHDQDSLSKFGDRDMTITWKNPEKQVMAGQDDVQINVKVKNLPSSVAGKNYALKLNGNDWEINSSLNYTGGLSAQVDKNQITFTVNKDFNNQGKESTDLDFNLTLLGNPDTVKEPKVAPISFTLFDGDKAMFTNNNIKANVVPLKDQVGDEFAKVFWIGYVNDDNNVPADLQGKNVLQWGVYWNYDGADLENVHYNQSFSEGQKIITDSIKVYEVKPGQAVNPDGTRKNLNDYYNEVTTGTEVADMEDLLKTHICNNDRDINVDTISGPFKIGNNDYSKKMFFIQMDTNPDINYLDNIWTKPGNGPAATIEPSNYSNKVFSGTSHQTYKGFGFNGKFDPSNGEYLAQLFVGEVPAKQQNDPQAEVTNLGAALQNDHKLTFSDLTALAPKTSDEIHFSNPDLALTDYIAQIEKQGYTFIGISSDKFNNKQDLAKIDKANDFAKADQFGHFTQTPKNFTLLFVKNPEKPNKPTDPEKPTKPEKPTTPDKPTKPNKPETPNKPTTPDVPVVPDQPVDPEPTPQPHPQPTPDVPEVPEVPEEDNDENNIPKPHASQTDETPEVNENHGASHAVTKEVATVQPKANKVAESDESTVKPLPQTGSKQSINGLIGLAFAGLAGIFSLATDRKRKN